jgi:signal transduction histidine kinase
MSALIDMFRTPPQRSPVRNRCRAFAGSPRWPVGRAVVGSTIAVALAASWVALRRVLGARTRCAQLERDRAILRATIENAPVGLAFSSPDGVFQFINATLRREAEREGRLPIRTRDVPAHVSLYWPDGRKIEPDQWDDLYSQVTEKPIEFDDYARRPGEASTWYWNSFAPVRDENDGSLLGTVAIVRDVSAEHDVEELRQELVAVIVHDLRSPIAAISLSLQNTLRNHREGEDHVRVPVAALDRALRSAKRLGEMVERLLDASRVELRELPLVCAETDLASFLAQLVGDLRPGLRGHEVVTDLPPHPVLASIDGGRIVQVVTNLLDNASKYAREGTAIRVTLRQDGDAAQIAVADEGEGIRPDDVPKLFDRFFQTKKARRQKSGLGLGLYITKGIVDAHGGRLTVDSTPGIGSTFHVWLPARSPANAPS